MKAFKSLLSCAALVLLAACGGGGADEPPATPVPSVQLLIEPMAVALGQTATLTWTSSNATTCAAAGAWSGSQPLAGSQPVVPSAAGAYTYTLNCTGPGGSAASSVTLSVGASAIANSVPIVIGGGPTGARAMNTPYVSVTVCVPGTAACQTIDHVLLDTGSYGLRVMQSALGTNLPAETAPGGGVYAECANFVNGFTWGSVRRADVRMGGELASAIPIQVVGDTPAGVLAVPSSCSGRGSDLSSVAAFGANGVLGVGVFELDCDICHIQSSTGYYSCKNGVCTPSTIPQAQTVANPVARFALNNNGTLISLPPVGDLGASSVSGALIFGIGTQANNGLGNANIYTTNASGNFTTTYKGKVLNASFLDSGSNALFFDDTALPPCPLSSGFYCPPAPAFLSAVNTGANGFSRAVSFSVVGVDGLDATVVAANLGAPARTFFAGATFDWGLPFFFGKNVFTAIEGKATPGGVGPYWAF